MKVKAKELLVHYFEVAAGKEMPADCRAEIGEIVEAIVCAAADEVESRRASAREIVRRELEEAREIIRDLADDEDAGLVWQGSRLACAYCDADGLYSVAHADDCPIVRGRRALTTEVSDGE